MPQLNPVPVAPSAPPGPSASSSAAADHEPAASFHDVLTDHQARTDSPEGQAGSDDTLPASDSDQQVATPAPAQDVQPDDRAVPPAAAGARAAPLAATVAPAPAVIVAQASPVAAADA